MDSDSYYNMTYQLTPDDKKKMKEFYKQWYKKWRIFYKIRFLIIISMILLLLIDFTILYIGTRIHIPKSTTDLLSILLPLLAFSGALSIPPHVDVRKYGWYMLLESKGYIDSPDFGKNQLWKTDALDPFIQALLKDENKFSTEYEN